MNIKNSQFNNIELPIDLLMVTTLKTDFEKKSEFFSVNTFTIRIV